MRSVMANKPNSALLNSSISRVASMICVVFQTCGNTEELEQTRDLLQIYTNKLYCYFGRVVQPTENPPLDAVCMKSDRFLSGCALETRVFTQMVCTEACRSVGHSEQQRDDL